MLVLFVNLRRGMRADVVLGVQVWVGNPTDTQCRRLSELVQ